MKKRTLLLMAMLLCVGAVFHAKAFAADDFAPPPMGENAQTLPETVNTATTPTQQQPATQPESGSGNGGGSAASVPAQNATASNPQPAQNATASTPQPAQSTPSPQPSAVPTVSPAPTPGVTPQTSQSPQPTPESAPSESAAQAPAETPGDGADRYIRIAVILALTAMLFVAVVLKSASGRRKNRR